MTYRTEILGPTLIAMAGLAFACSDAATESTSEPATGGTTPGGAGSGTDGWAGTGADPSPALGGGPPTSTGGTAGAGTGVGGSPPASAGGESGGGALGGAPGASGSPGAAGSQPAGDECDSTGDCVAIYGAAATDCVDSQSEQSWCACGADPCSGGSGSGGTAGTGGSGGSGGASGSGGSGGSPPTGSTGVYIEVESISPVAPWVEETVYADYSGTSYFRWPDVATNANGITSSQDAVLNYPFTIDTAGTYLVEVRGRRDHEGWCQNAADDACNDIFAKMDDGAWTKKMIKEGTWGDWVWDGKWEPGSSVITTEIPLSAGSHTFSMSGRSNGVKIDAIRIYLRGTTPPTP